MKPQLLLPLLAATVSAAVAAPKPLTNTAGTTIEAEWLKLENGKLSVRLPNGKETSIPLTRLDATSREAVDAWAAADETGSAPPESLLEAAGQPLFTNTKPLWSSPAEEAASRLGWPKESKTPRQSSFRAYPGKGYRFFGARPYSAALYGVGGDVSSLSLVYANKGDFFGGGSGEDHFDNDEVTDEGIAAFEKAMESDEDAIAKALTSALGEPTVQRFGEGKSKRKVSRWDWGEHAFLLSAEDGEYVSLIVQPTSLADEGGKGEKVADAEVRPRIRANVKNRENGDVVIQNLPMVDQGPKGYCVPATFERCMRYLDVPADMYLLAMAGQSGLGGGTSVERLISAVERDVRRKGRKFDILSGSELRINRLAKYIDDGIPVVWALHSTSWFNDTANARSAARRETTDWEAWTQEMSAAGKAVKNLDRADGAGHVVIITGYNKTTGEIAFSDSWGERYKERWITVTEAEHFSQGRLYVIRL